MDFLAALDAGDRATRELTGRAVIYTPSDGDPVTVTGIFDKVATRVDLSQPGISSSSPLLFLKLSDLPSDPETDTNAFVTVDGVDYTAWDVRKDGTGAVSLYLHEL